MGVARAGRGRAVAVDVDPNVQNFFQNFPIFFGRLPRGLPARENRISTQGADRNGLGKSTAHVGWVWCGCGEMKHGRFFCRASFLVGFLEAGAQITPGQDHRFQFYIISDK